MNHFLREYQCEKSHWILFFYYPMYTYEEGRASLTSSFFLLVTLLINVTEAFHFEKESAHSELLDTALPLLWPRPGLAESPPEWAVFNSGSGSARGGSAVGNGNIHSLRAGDGAGDKKFHLPTQIWVHFTLSAIWRFAAFTLLSDLNFFKRNICFWCMEQAIKASLGNLLMLLQNCSAGMVACTGEECSEWRIMWSTFRLIHGWREAHTRNINYILGPLIHHKYLI